MAVSPSPTVTLSRRPHRDAVLRLREAYRRLAQPAGLLDAPPRDGGGARLGPGDLDETERGRAPLGPTPGGE